MGVGPLHTIDEVGEGNEAMEKGIEGSDTALATFQPNLARVNEVAIRTLRLLRWV
jgi:hypothetical protein